MITHGAIVPKVGLQSIRLANYVQYLPKGTRLSVAFGARRAAPTSRTSDSATRVDLARRAFLSLQALTKPVSG